MNIAHPQVYDISKDKEKDFEAVFKTHFKSLQAYALTIIRDAVMAEEMVQNVFVRLWEKSEQIEIRESVSGYLYRSVYHECLNYLKHLKVRDAYEAYAVYSMETTSSSNGAQHTEHKELQERLEVALRELPEKCRTIFQMSRFEELKYQEIADRLSIPVKMVENQMGKALKLLRVQLVDYLPITLILFLIQ